ncbi:hypothetical protein [Qaidamihabitans albus]|uniref:hypothetical protein n=1 Tax=Qaidamihabitans albus TaxID=2795733 RepID=UPI0018F1B582|nr:hypothetical protein [Qaidamihabitans albus]
MTAAEPHPKFPMATFTEPSPRGFLYLGLEVVAPGPGPFVRRSAERDTEVAGLTELAEALEKVPEVAAVHVYRAVMIPPIRGGPRFDLAVLVETTSPEDISAVRSTSHYRDIGATFAMPARNVERIGRTDASRPGTMLFNHFTAPDPDRAVAVWQTLTGWYTDKTGIDNSTALVPLEEAPYALVNYARLPDGPGRFLFQQLLRPSFHRFVRARLAAHDMKAMPVLCEPVRP